MVRITRSSRRILGAALAGVVAILLAVPAAAQGLYYKEITKDGRIYVFNSARNAALFEQTGGMFPELVTRPAYVGS